MFIIEKFVSNLLCCVIFGWCLIKDIKTFHFDNNFQKIVIYAVNNSINNRLHKRGYKLFTFFTELADID